jgi:L-glyceraldehyde 3-phosphate reductase
MGRHRGRDRPRGALDRLAFSSEELEEIDRYATESGINLWAASSRE